MCLRTWKMRTRDPIIGIQTRYAWRSILMISTVRSFPIRFLLRLYHIAMSDATVREMLANAVHIGFKRRYWSPKMREYIYGAQNDVHVFDLYKTEACLQWCQEALSDFSAKGKTILIVGTKIQARELVKQFAEETGIFYVHSKWVPGLLTNFSTIKRRITTFVKLEEELENGALDGLTKKERAVRIKELNELRRSYQGIRDMKKVPDVVFVIDGKYESLALEEAKKLRIASIALLGSTGDIDMANHFVPCNVNSIKSLDYILNALKPHIKKPKTTENTNKIRRVEQKPTAESVEPNPRSEH